MHIRYQQLIAICLALMFAPEVSAYENHQMWDKVRVGGKLCMKSHEHHGQSPLWVSKKGARAYSRRAWERFTTWEYGKAWGKLRLAAGRRERCVQTGKRWMCSIIARPCRPWRRRRRR